MWVVVPLLVVRVRPACSVPRAPVFSAFPCAPSVILALCAGGLVFYVWRVLRRWRGCCFREVNDVRQFMKMFCGASIGFCRVVVRIVWAASASGVGVSVSWPRGSVGRSFDSALVLVLPGMV